MISQLNFGNIVLIIFLLCQCLDGVFTYVGVTTINPDLEINPIVAYSMRIFGVGWTLITAKSLAGLIGIWLHLYEAHRIIALISGLYLGLAIIPWAIILFF